MTPKQQKEIRELADQLNRLTNELDSGGVSDLYVSTTLESGGAFVLSANEDGCIYLASILLSLARNARPNQHFHFDQTTVLSQCQCPLVIKFDCSPWSGKEGA